VPTTSVRTSGLTPFRTACAPLGVPICTRAAIHFIAKVVPFLSRAAIASLPGSPRSRAAKSDSCQFKTCHGQASG
jgi:hypothetical protein